MGLVKRCRISFVLGTILHTRQTLTNQRVPYSRSIAGRGAQGSPEHHHRWPEVEHLRLPSSRAAAPCAWSCCSAAREIRHPKLFDFGCDLCAKLSDFSRSQYPPHGSCRQIVLFRINAYCLIPGVPNCLISVGHSTLWTGPVDKLSYFADMWKLSCFVK